MSPASSRTFFITNVVVNRVVILVLKSWAGRRLGRRLAVVEYIGGRCGRRHRLVTLYVADGRTVRIEVGMAERKTWWRNFRAPHPVRLRLAGEDHDATAHVVRDGDRVCVVAELEPRAAAHRSALLGPPRRNSTGAPR
jgi:hypothetical protein